MTPVSTLSYKFSLIILNDQIMTTTIFLLSAQFLFAIF
ncbi:hypothetical protein PMAG_a0652 [Pseudoalteromonas mariniglutinosa NCIMB 1770]|nr:hypothetical protein [Pseudoalteromonas mariniglutinosa NCIMB 1770]